MSGTPHTFKRASPLLALYSCLPLYTPISNIFLVYWACGTVEQTHFLRADPIIECGGRLHKEWQGIAIIGVIIWVILPPVLLAIILLNRSTQNRLGEPSVQRVWGTLYLGFREEACLWGLVENWKTLTFSIVPLYFMEQPAAQITLLLLILLLYCMLHAANRPFTDRIVDRVAFIGHIAVFFMLLCALVIVTGAPIPGALVAGVPMLPVVIGGLAFVYVGLEVVCRKWRHNRQRIRSRSLALQSKVEQFIGMNSSEIVSETSNKSEEEPSMRHSSAEGRRREYIAGCCGGAAHF